MLLKEDDLEMYHNLSNVSLVLDEMHAEIFEIVNAIIKGKYLNFLKMLCLHFISFFLMGALLTEEHYKFSF